MHHKITTINQCQKQFLFFLNSIRLPKYLDAKFALTFYVSQRSGLGPISSRSPICGAGSEYSASQDWTAVQVVSSVGTGNWILCLVLEGWFYFPCDCNSRPSLSLRFTDWKIVRWQRLLVVVSRNRLSPIDSLGLVRSSCLQFRLS